jgi:hypothetical protein
MHTDRTLPDHARDQRMSTDAAVITGEIARRLALARSRISADCPPLDQAS